MKRPLSLGASVALIALSGCGAANSLIPEIDNLMQLNGSSATATVGSGRAVISGNVSRSVTFPDRDLPSANKLKRMKLRQSLDSSVSVTVPNGASLPASFTVSNLTLSITLSDAGERTAESSATYAGPVTMTRQGSTNTYSTSTPIEVSNITFSNAPFTTVREIITTAPSPNTVTARLSFDTDDTQLPSGSTVTFSFAGGKAKVEL